MATPLAMAIARRVSELADERGMSIKDLAALCSISQPRLRRRLTGAVSFNLTEIAGVLDVLCAGEPSDLLMYVEAKHPELLGR